MKSLPLVSAIIPMYNVENYIEACINSVILQTYKKLQIILINDGSPDSSTKIAKKFQLIDDRVIVYDQENAGVSSARNAGLDLATGEYICFVDGDDRLAPDFIDRMLNNALELDADMVISTRVLSAPCPPGVVTNHTPEVWSTEKTISEILYAEIPLGCWNKLYKKSLIDKSQLRFETCFYMGEGLNFVISAAQNAERIASTNQALYYYRKDNTKSATTQLTANKMRNALAAIKNVEQNLSIKSHRTMAALNFHRWLTCLYALNNIIENKKQKEEKDLFEYCQSILQKNSRKVLMDSRVSYKRKVKIAATWLFPSAVLWLIRRKST